MSGEIVLITGQRIPDPAEKLNRFVKVDDSFELYDLQDIPKDDILTPLQIWIADAIGARLEGRGVTALKGRLDKVKQALSKIPADSSLTDPERKIPWTELKDLFLATMGPYIKAPRATKILHKKRPDLIPVIDSVLRAYCEAAHGKQPGGALGGRGTNEAEELLTAMKIFKKDLDNNRKVLQQLALSETQAKALTLVRRLEKLIWGWGGYNKHKPKWMTDSEWDKVRVERRRYIPD